MYCLPGILAQRLLPESTEVWLLDFNDTVLLETTLLSWTSCPLEHQQGSLPNLERYTVAGDWLALSAWLKAHDAPPFDLILSMITK